MPGRGKCKSWNGVYLPSFAAVSISTRTGCTSSDGTMLRLNLVTSRLGVAFNDYIELPLHRNHRSDVRREGQPDPVAQPARYLIRRPVHFQWTPPGDFE